MVVLEILLPCPCRNQDIFRILVGEVQRNHQIARDVMAAYSEGRKILVLTERTDHLKRCRKLLSTALKICSSSTGVCRKNDGRQFLPLLPNLKTLLPVFYLPPAGWLAKVSIIHPLTLWFWPCPFHGRARCNNTQGGCTVNMAIKRISVFMIMLKRISLNWQECGINADVAIRPWATGLKQIRYNLQYIETFDLSS